MVGNLTTPLLGSHFEGASDGLSAIMKNLGSNFTLTNPGNAGLGHKVMPSNCFNVAVYSGETPAVPSVMNMIAAAVNDATRAVCGVAPRTVLVAVAIVASVLIVGIGLTCLYKKCAQQEKAPSVLGAPTPATPLLDAEQPVVVHPFGTDPGV